MAAIPAEIPMRRDSLLSSPELKPQEQKLSAEAEPMAKQFPFMNLPPELRNQVVESYCTNGSTDTYFGPDTANQLALLCTCRKIYHEALLLAFARNTFHTTQVGTKEFARQFSNLPLALRGAVKRITLTVSTTRFNDGVLSWGPYAFGNSELDLDELQIAFRRHLPPLHPFQEGFQYLAIRSNLRSMLSELTNVKKVVVVNQAIYGPLHYGPRFDLEHHAPGEAHLEDWDVVRWSEPGKQVVEYRYNPGVRSPRSSVDLS